MKSSRLPRAGWAAHGLAYAALAPALLGCVNHKLGPPAGPPTEVRTSGFVQSVARELDILFMIDNSGSMSPLQTKLRARLPEFIAALSNLPVGGIPNLHIAVVSSSLGAGAFGAGFGCAAPLGNDQGAFRHEASCTALAPGETFIKAGPDATLNNFTGDLSALFSCMALLGENGCGFEQQLASPMAALQRATIPGDPNYGFLRPDAFFALVMLTNEDDSSVPSDSTIFDPSVESVADPSGLGGLQSYRQNEFGHLCDGKKLPHLPPAAPLTLANCQSNEDPDPSYADKRHLIRVKDFVDFFSKLKSEPDRVYVAAIAGPPTPYIVESAPMKLSNGTSELQPVIRHSCVQNSGEYADPAVRIQQFVEAFGPDNGVFRNICTDDFGPALVAIAEGIGRRFIPQCVNGTLVMSDDAPGRPDCVVTLRPSGATGGGGTFALPACDDVTPGNFPCWKLLLDPAGCPSGRRAQICGDFACAPDSPPPVAGSVTFACAVST